MNSFIKTNKTLVTYSLIFLIVKSPSIRLPIKSQ